MNPHPQPPHILNHACLADWVRDNPELARHIERTEEDIQGITIQTHDEKTERFDFPFSTHRLNDFLGSPISGSA